MPATPNQSAPVMEEGAGAPATGGKTADVPLAVFPEAPKEGDVCGFKIVAVNAENGTATIAYADEGHEDMGGADGMANEFSKDKMAAASGGAKSNY